MRELIDKIKEALISTLPITAIVYILAMTPLFDFSSAELVTFTVGAVLPGMFSRNSMPVSAAAGLVEQDTK